MLQQPARPSGNVQLPYTTADMSERLAKRKAEQDAELQRQRSAALRFGIANPPAQQDSGGGGLWPNWKELGNAGKIAGKGVLGMVNTIAATPIDTVDFAVQQLEKAVGVKPTDKFDPASVGSFNLLGETYRGVDNAAQYVGKQIAAIPGAGKPSSSPFMDTVRSRGWLEALAEPIVHGINVASVAYPLSKFAVNTRIPQIAGSAYQDMLEARLAYKNRSPFPTVKTPGSVIDVDALQGSRLPARIVDTPATPATRLAEAQTQRALPPAEIAPEITNVTSLNAFRTKTNRNDPRWRTKDSYGFLQDESFKPITTANDQVEYDAVFLTYSPPGMKELLDELNFKPYNKEGALSYNYKGVIPLFNDQLFLKINNGHHNGMGNFIDVYEQPPLWDFVNEDQLKYLGQAYGPETTRRLQRIFATAAPEAPTTPATRLAEAQTQRGLPPAATPEMTAQIQRQTARTELGLNIQDIDFPPKGNELTRPRMFDTSGYGVFPEDAWPELGLAQHKAGVNNTTMPQEMDALRTYFSNEYDSFQDLLRNPYMMSTPTTKIFQKYIEKIDNIFKVTSPTTENFKVFRGVNADSPMPDGEFVGAFYLSLKEGDFIVEPAYMSTSISKTVASEWANSHPDDYLLIIHAPKGSVAVHPIVSWEYGIDEIAQHMNAPSEQELLFNRGTVLKILSNDMGVIEAEMVPMYQQVDNLISTSGIKESLLKQYSYKDLAEMVAGEQSKADFYVEYFKTLPDLEQFLTVNQAQRTKYDLANTVVELNDELAGSINPRDYWKFRDIIDQIVDANKTPLTTNNRYAAAKKLLQLLDKHNLTNKGTTKFIRNNLDDIFQPPEYNAIIDQPVAKFLDNLKKANKQLPTVLKNFGEYSLKTFVETIKTDPKLASKMIWNQYLQHVKKLPNSNADFIKQVEALPKFFVDGNVISYQEAIMFKKNIDANKPIG